ncbi:MAG: glycosyltransferase family 9 protein [Candidatus Omnitrophica bacterium]|nr:glycosyltransferase family 9 protein [Candidatus Omnitrophota bacterium]
MYNKILLVELAGIGDAVLSSPAIKSLKDNYPSSSVHFLTFAGPADLIRKSPYIESVFIFRKGVKGILNNIFVLIKLKRLRIDLAINLKHHYRMIGVLKMYFLLRFINPKKTVGRNTNGKADFYDIKVKDEIDSERHDVEYKLDLLRALGCEIKDKRLQVWFEDSEAKEVGVFLKKNFVSDLDFLIGINPVGYRPTRRWDWKKFAEVGKILSNRYKAKVIITGAKNDRWLTERISHSIFPKPLDSSGRLSLTQLPALIKRCKIYITNDTGSMHIANALETPLVAIMGPGTMKLAPYQRENCIIIRKEVECSPCYKFRCRNMSCLDIISVDDVIQAAAVLLKS